MLHKTTLGIIAGLLFILVMTACSSTEGAKIEEVFTKSSEVSKDLESFAITMESEQTIDTGMDTLPEGGIPISSKIDAVHQTDPEAFHQTIHTMGEEIEQYYSSDGLFMKTPAEDGWVKAPEDVLNELNAMSTESQTPSDQLEQLEDHIEDFQLEQEDGQYILSFESNGDSGKELIEEAVQEGLATGEIPKDVLDGLTVHELSYRMAVDKETYYPQMFKINMDFTIEENGESVNLNQAIYSEFSRYNEIDSITIPDQVKENAKEVEDMPGAF